MRRREFIAGLGGAAAIAWPRRARAQQPALPVIGYLDSLDPQTGAFALSLFRKVLSEAGYVEGRNVAIEFRWAEGQVDRLPALAADLVRRRVAVIVTVSSADVALAAKASTATIPIVFTSGGDPVQSGLVASLNRPGGNATGVSLLGVELGPKRLEMLRELVPQAATIACLVNSNNTTAQPFITDVQAAARSVGQQIVILNAGTTTEIDKAFETMGRQQVGGLIVMGDRFLTGRRDQLVALAACYRIPASYFARSFVEAGGLMSYGDDRLELWRQAANYIRRILKGEKPADLPVVQPTKLELVINLKTARTLGLTVPNTLIVAADEVIE
jgi:putative tryptophan/tyrosine transport system substrate-binding protein